MSFERAGEREAAGMSKFSSLIQAPPVSQASVTETSTQQEQNLLFGKLSMEAISKIEIPESLIKILSSIPVNKSSAVKYCQPQKKPSMPTVIPSTMRRFPPAYKMSESQEMHQSANVDHINPYKQALHTQAAGINASLGPAVPWKLTEVTILSPDFSNFKVGRDDPQHKKDPRIQKYFGFTDQSD